MSYDHKDPIPTHTTEMSQPPNYNQTSLVSDAAYAPAPQPIQPERTITGTSVPQQDYYATQPIGQQTTYHTPPPQAQYQTPPPQIQYETQIPKQQYQQQQQFHNGQQQQFATVTPIALLTSSPAPVQCPACGQRAMTHTNFVTGNTTHAWAAGLCVVLLLGCIPYCVSSTKDVEQKCGNCGVKLCTWHRSGRTEVHMHG